MSVCDNLLFMAYRAFEDLDGNGIQDENESYGIGIGITVIDMKNGESYEL